MSLSLYVFWMSQVMPNLLISWSCPQGPTHDIMYIITRVCTYQAHTWTQLYICAARISIISSSTRGHRRTFTTCLDVLQGKWYLYIRVYRKASSFCLCSPDTQHVIFARVAITLCIYSICVRFAAAAQSRNNDPKQTTNIPTRSIPTTTTTATTTPLPRRERAKGQ